MGGPFIFVPLRYKSILRNQCKCYNRFVYPYRRLYKVYGSEKGIPEAERLNLKEDPYYHSLLGYMYADTDTDKAIHHYEKAIGLTKSRVEKQTLSKEIERLSEKKERG